MSIQTVGESLAVYDGEQFSGKFWRNPSLPDRNFERMITGILVLISHSAGPTLFGAMKGNHVWSLGNDRYGSICTACQAVIYGVLQRICHSHSGQQSLFSS